MVKTIYTVGYTNARVPGGEPANVQAYYTHDIEVRHDPSIMTISEKVDDDDKREVGRCHQGILRNPRYELPALYSTKDTFSKHDNMEFVIGDGNHDCQEGGQRKLSADDAMDIIPELMNVDITEDQFKKITQSGPNGRKEQQLEWLKNKLGYVLLNASALKQGTSMVPILSRIKRVVADMLFFDPKQYNLIWGVTANPGTAIDPGNQSQHSELFPPVESGETTKIDFTSEYLENMLGIPTLDDAGECMITKFSITTKDLNDVVTKVKEDAEGGSQKLTLDEKKKIFGMIGLDHNGVAANPRVYSATMNIVNVGVGRLVDYFWTINLVILGHPITTWAQLAKYIQGNDTKNNFLLDNRPFGPANLKEARKYFILKMLGDTLQAILNIIQCVIKGEEYSKGTMFMTHDLWLLPQAARHMFNGGLNVMGKIVRGGTWSLGIYSILSDWESKKESIINDLKNIKLHLKNQKNHCSGLKASVDPGTPRNTNSSDTHLNPPLITGGGEEVRLSNDVIKKFNDWVNKKIDSVDEGIRLFKGEVHGKERCGEKDFWDRVGTDSTSLNYFKKQIRKFYAINTAFQETRYVAKKSMVITLSSKGGESCEAFNPDETKAHFADIFTSDYPPHPEGAIMTPAEFKGFFKNREAETYKNLWDPKEKDESIKAYATVYDCIRASQTFVKRARRKPTIRTGKRRLDFKHSGNATGGANKRGADDDDITPQDEDEDEMDMEKMRMMMDELSSERQDVRLDEAPEDEEEEKEEEEEEEDELEVRWNKVAEHIVDTLENKVRGITEGDVKKIEKDIDQMLLSIHEVDNGDIFNKVKMIRGFTFEIVIDYLFSRTKIKHTNLYKLKNYIYSAMINDDDKDYINLTTNVIEGESKGDDGDPIDMVSSSAGEDDDDEVTPFINNRFIISNEYMKTYLQRLIKEGDDYQGSLRAQRTALARGALLNLSSAPPHPAKFFSPPAPPPSFLPPSVGRGWGGG